MSNYSNSLDFKLKQEQNDNTEDNTKDKELSRNIYKVVSIPVKYENGEKVCVFNTIPVNNEKI